MDINSPGGRIFLGGLVATLLAGGASADWQSTKWGMNPNQVKKAMVGSAVEWGGVCDGTAPGKFGLHMSYAAGSFKFHGCASGTAKGGLDEVVLGLAPDPGSSKAAAAVKLKSELSGKYGKPFDERDVIGEVQITEWHHGNDKIVLNVMSVTNGPETMLVYSPLLDANNKGL